MGTLFNLEQFLWLCRRLLISFSSICGLFLLDSEPVEFYWESHCLWLLLPVYSMFFPVLASGFRYYVKELNLLWVETCTAWKTWAYFQCSARRYLVFPTTFVEETVFSPSYVLGAFVKNQVDIASWIHICIFCSTGLIFVFVSVPCCFYCYGSVV
jgi:hypothetical protein